MINRTSRFCSADDSVRDVSATGGSDLSAYCYRSDARRPYLQASTVSTTVALVESGQQWPQW